jgi:uncharacterized protein YbjT (DUF2867 family)
VDEIFPGFILLEPKFYCQLPESILKGFQPRSEQPVLKRVVNMSGRILLTGATGYVGGKLLQRLEFERHQVNCLVRDPSRVKVTSPSTRVFQGDLLYRSTLWRPFQGVETAYYLVHSLADSNDDFEANEIKAANNFAVMAREAGVKRIIYLGGLGSARRNLSRHLKSRHDVGYALRHSGVPTIELRASIVLGAGSLSFEMIRSLTEHLPVMVMPRWVSVKAQPIGIHDLLDYLMQSMQIRLDESTVVEIGGTDQLSYRDLMIEYAQQRHLKRLMLPVPVLTPWLSSLWLGLVTPMQAIIGKKLIESIRNPTVVEDSSAEKLFNVKPCSASAAIRRALQEVDTALTDRTERAGVEQLSMAGQRSSLRLAD